MPTTPAPSWVMPSSSSTPTPARWRSSPIDLGANDIFLDCGGDPGCFNPQIATNLPFILDTLRTMPGPDVPIVGMNYFAPTSSQWFDDPAAGEAATAPTVLFNNFLESLYGGAGVPVADVESAFAVTDFRRWSTCSARSLSVFNACALTWLCTSAARPRRPCQQRGYGVIAQAFATALGLNATRSRASKRSLPTALSTVASPSAGTPHPGRSPVERDLFGTPVADRQLRP